jgi:hypothetical protein
VIRIAVLNFVHDGSPARGEVLLAWEPRYMGGFVKVAREHSGVELVGIESPLWPRLEALPYRNVDISKFDPYGDPPFEHRSRPC